MKRNFFVSIALAASALTATAGTYQIGHAQDCPALKQRQVFETVNQVGIDEGLDLPTGRRINGEMRCYRHPTISEN